MSLMRCNDEDAYQVCIFIAECTDSRILPRREVRSSERRTEIIHTQSRPPGTGFNTQHNQDCTKRTKSLMNHGSSGYKRAYRYI